MSKERRFNKSTVSQNFQELGAALSHGKGLHCQCELSSTESARIFF